MIEKSFGDRIKDVVYKYREGVYAIIVDDESKVAIVKTKKGYFMLGGGLKENETHEACIKRECLEEVGMDVIIKDFICKGGKYSWVDGIGYMYGIGYFYFAKSKGITSNPIEKDHELVWIDIKKCSKNMYLEHQAWALQQALYMLSLS